jgi:hydrogenase/urease accessory protein HupE
MFLRFLLLLSLAFLLPSVSLAHDARPVVVTLNEQAPDVFFGTVRVPPVLPANNFPMLLWPEHCSTTAQGGNNIWTCPGGLEGESFSLVYPQANPSLATYFRLNFLDGTSRNMMLTPSETSWEVEPAPSPLEVSFVYTVLGIEHILIGLDHLLFVLGLLVISGTMKRILLTVTGFTLAHSITLFLSTLGIINLPIAPVEAVIALSILFLAHEISRNHTDSWTYRAPVIVSFSFGLLHGLGFASALGDVGVVQEQFLLSLMFFNVGVEFGQLIFIGMVLIIYQFFRRLYQILHQQAFASVNSALNIELLVAYSIGIPSAYWVIERSAGFLF